MTATTQKELERKLRAYIKSGTGLSRVIPGQEDGPRPKVTYATVTFVSDEQIGHALRAQSQTAEKLSLYRRSTYQVQFYRDEAYDKALAFQTWAETEQGLQKADEEGFRLGYPFELRNVTLPVGEEWEHRTVLDLTVEYLTDQTSQDTDYTESVDVDITSEQGEELGVDRATVNQ